MEKSMRNLTREQNIRVWAVEQSLQTLPAHRTSEDVLRIAKKYEDYVLDTIQITGAVKLAPGVVSLED